MTTFRPPTYSRLCATILVAALIVQPLATFGATITPTLAQVPIQGLNPVKPNIMLTLDDSGSMGMELDPDFIAYPGSGIYHCRDGAATSLHCGGNKNSDGNPGSSWLPSRYDPPFRSSDYNEAFYDRTIAYTPGKKADGTNLPCQGSDTSCVSPWTAVYVNGYDNYPGTNGGGTINLTTGYPDTIWCWSASPSAADKLTADSNGAACRRNGRAYSLVTTGGNTMPAIAAGTTIRTARSLAPARRSANSSTRSTSTAVLTTSPSHRSGTVRPRIPPAGERPPA